MKFLNESLIAIDAQSTTAEEAIRQAGDLLMAVGSVEDRYIEAMVQSFHKNGPYFVISPGIAMPHARPEDGVTESSVSLIKLKHNVRFGNTTNDPVSLVFGIGATSGAEHLSLLQKLTHLLNSKETTTALLNAQSTSEIQSIIEKRN
jgi:PTS system ascorbate-specific IIA component